MSSASGWIKSYGGSQDDRANAIFVDSNDANVFVIGSSSSVSNLQSELFVSKFSKDGEMLYYQQIGCKTDDNGVSLTMDRYNTSIYAYGSSTCYRASSSAISNNRELALFKMSATNLGIFWGTYIGTQYDDDAS